MRVLGGLWFACLAAASVYATVVENSGKSELSSFYRERPQIRERGNTASIKADQELRTFRIPAVDALVVQIRIAREEYDLALLATKIPPSRLHKRQEAQVLLDSWMEEWRNAYRRFPINLDTVLNRTRQGYYLSSKDYSQHKWAISAARNLSSVSFNSLEDHINWFSKTKFPFAMIDPFRMAQADLRQWNKLSEYLVQLYPDPFLAQQTKTGFAVIESVQTDIELAQERGDQTHLVTEAKANQVKLLRALTQAIRAIHANATQVDYDANYLVAHLNINLYSLRSLGDALDIYHRYEVQEQDYIKERLQQLESSADPVDLIISTGKHLLRRYFEWRIRPTVKRIFIHPQTSIWPTEDQIDERLKRLDSYIQQRSEGLLNIMQHMNELKKSVEALA